MKKKIMLLTLITSLSVNLFACGNRNENLKNDEISSFEKIYANPEKSPNTQENEKKEEATKVVPNIAAKESSVKSPLEIGQVGIINEYSYYDKKAYNTFISLTNVMRGEEAKKFANEYTSKNTKGNEIPQLMSNQLEYAIAEYTLTLSNDFPDQKHDASDSAHPKVCNLDGEPSIVYDSISYDLSTTELYTGNYSIEKGQSNKYYYVFAIPKGCSDYLISFNGYKGPYTPGYDKPEAYFRGK